MRSTSDSLCEIDDGEYDQNEDEYASDAVAHDVALSIESANRRWRRNCRRNVDARNHATSNLGRRALHRLVLTFVRAGGWASRLMLEVVIL